MQALFLAPVPEAGRQRVQQFSAKLDLVMKLANISRGRLAAAVGVDKSVVSRWLNGRVHPSGHNLTVITDVVRREWPDFSLLTWDLPLEEIARVIGAPAPVRSDAGAAAAAPAVPVAGLPLRTLDVSRAVVPREGWVYPGLYLGFRQAFANTGLTIAKGLMIRQDDDRLLAQAADGWFNYRGEAVLLRGQLFVILEEAERLDEIVTLVLNGVSAPIARVLDGLMLGVAGDRTGTPSATPIVFQRVHDTSGDPMADQNRWAELVVEVERVNLERSARARMPAEFARVVDNRVGLPRGDGDLDHLLRVPQARSLAASTSETKWRP